MVLETLKGGRDNVKSSYAIARETGLPQRTIGFAVNNLRKQGELIGSIHGAGYYLIETADELNDTIAHIEHRKRGIDATIRSLDAAWLVRNA